jgi:hypothetical protein
MVFLQREFISLLFDAIVDKSMNESSRTLGNTAYRHLFIFVLIQHSSLEYFPEFEVGSTENL